MDDWEFEYPENANVTVDPDERTLVDCTAKVSSKANLDAGVRIGPYSVIGPGVTLHRGVHAGSFVVIGGNTTIEAGTRIFPFSTLGTKPQDFKHGGEDTELWIGPRNTIREYVNISTGTASGTGKTVLGSGNMIMAYSHVGHDCRVGDGCVLANAVNLGGHVEIRDRVFVGGMSGVHQFTRVGELAMIAGGTMLLRDLPPFCMAQGYGGEITGLNFVGLKRSRLGEEEINELKTMFHTLYKAGLSLREALKQLREQTPPSREKSVFIEFLETSERGICR